jgi:hypothetical protein
MYYIACPKHMGKENHWIFWKPKAAGYTYDLNEAGLYPDNYRNYPIIVSKRPPWGKYDNFLIHKDNVHILGRVQSCVICD